MDLIAVTGKLRAALGTIPGLRVPAWGIQSVQAPAGIVALPDRILFNQTYNGSAAPGTDTFKDVPIVILVGAPTERSSILALAAYVAGPLSVKAALEGYSYGATCDFVHVEFAEFDVPKYAGIDYLAATFHADIVGNG